MFLREIHDDLELKSYCFKFEHIYIYGTGKYGKICADLLNSYDIPFHGFIVSKKDKDFLGIYKVYSQQEILNRVCDKDGIILAMKQEYQLEVLNDIGNEFQCGLISFTNSQFFRRILCKDFESHMLTLGKETPPMPYVGNDFHNILVVRLDRVGDLIWTSPFFRELRKNFPEAYITVVVSKANMLLMDCCPYVDMVYGYEYTYDEEIGRLSDEIVLNRAKEFALKNLKNRHYDVVFLPRGLMPKDNMANVYLAVFSSAKIRIGGFYLTNRKVDDWYRNCMKKLFSVLAEHEFPMHDVEKSLNLLKTINCYIKDNYTEVWYKERTIIANVEFDTLRHLHAKFDFLIAVGLTAQSGTKTWNSHYYRALFSTMKKDFSVCFLLFGGEESMENAKKAYDEECCMDFTGRTNLQEVMQLISLCDIYVGSDTGLKHIAAALNKPVIELSASFPWSYDDSGLSPKHCGAWNTKYMVIYPSKAAHEKCARAGFCVESDSHCINNISVNAVEDVLKGFLLYYDFSLNVKF